jgi:hypothetical protein
MKIFLPKAHHFPKKSSCLEKDLFLGLLQLLKRASIRLTRDKHKAEILRIMTHSGSKFLAKPITFEILKVEKKMLWEGVFYVRSPKVGVAKRHKIN